jgi:hypothetical protein
MGDITPVKSKFKELTVCSSTSSTTENNNASTPGLITMQSTTSTASTLSDGSFSNYSTPTNQIIPKMDPSVFADNIFTKRGFRWKYTDLEENEKTRIKRLMKPDTTPNMKDVTEKTFKEEYDSFCEGLRNEGLRNDLGQGWKNLSFVFFDEVARDKFMIIRTQTSGICYMHAGALLQHYLNCIRTKVHNHIMLDLSTYMRNDASMDDFERYIFQGGGGSSVDFFQEITGTDDLLAFTISPPDSTTACDDQAELLTKHFEARREPGLVSGFRIEANFHEKSKSVFDYKVKKSDFQTKIMNGKRTYVKHSMLLIGAHWDKETNQKWFLLQNFWRNKYFRLVSAEYMASCRATIYFVSDLAGDVGLSKDFGMTEGPRIETSIEYEECEAFNEF